MRPPRTATLGPAAVGVTGTARTPDGRIRPFGFFVEVVHSHLRSPCGSRCRRPSAALWLELVSARPVTWNLERYSRAAYLLGRFAASSAAAPLVTAVHGARTPRVDADGRLAGVVRPALSRPGVDFGFCGRAPLGTDLGGLVLSEVQAGHRRVADLPYLDAACTDAYLAGLGVGGDTAESARLRRAHDPLDGPSAQTGAPGPLCSLTSEPPLAGWPGRSPRRGGAAPGPPPGPLPTAGAAPRPGERPA
ncbi:hypothetical protein [Pseudonocardia pini]|uniref:hypothetical protein n=1 Tax=Pseudonocardia pini TaxID=2758030 RepID=UPI0015F044D8|nr:hypothetical protein [Pseudonocardia pini]